MDGVSSGAVTVLSLREAANSAFRSKQYQEACNLYSQAITLAEHLEDAEGLHLVYANRAASRLQLGDSVGALQDAHLALAVEPRFVKALYRGSAALLNLGRLQEAATMCLQALEVETANRELTLLMSRIDEARAQAAVEEASHNGTDQERLLHVDTPAASTHLHLTTLPAAVLPTELQPGHIFQASTDGINENILVLLHGLGDTAAPYARLAQRMALPHTASLAVQGPIEIPETDGGHAWFTAFDDDWELIQPSPSDSRRLRSLEQVCQLLDEAIEGLARLGWQYARIHLLGFSQGGTTALTVHQRFTGHRKLGGCISISGPLLEEQLWKSDRQSQASSSASSAIPQPVCGPLLITHGDRDDAIPRSLVDRTVAALHPHCTQVKSYWVKEKGHAMVQSEAEMRVLMMFWSVTLQSPAVPGSVEVKQ